jgi:ferritin-like metal-binding protein YciE
MPMTKTHDLLLHEPGDVLYAERQILKALPDLIAEAADPDLKSALQGHAQETEGQIANVEQAFALLGEKPKAEKCPGIKGILKEHDDFVTDEKPRGEILELFLLGSTLRVEHYEIAAYTSLIALASQLGHPDVASLLRKNLRQEKKMAAATEALGKGARRGSPRRCRAKTVGRGAASKWCVRAFSSPIRRPPSRWVG